MSFQALSSREPVKDAIDVFPVVAGFPFHGAVAGERHRRPNDLT